MPPELAITIASNLVTLLGGAIGIWYALRKGTDDAKTAAEAALKIAGTLDVEVSAVRVEANSLTIRVARMEVLQEQHGRELQQGMARIEAAVVALHARLDRALNRNSRSEE